jgi:hypothetical protein
MNLTETACGQDALDQPLCRGDLAKISQAEKE